MHMTWRLRDPLTLFFYFCSKDSGWVAEASLNHGRAFGVLARLDGKLHILGGEDGFILTMMGAMTNKDYSDSESDEEGPSWQCRSESLSNQG